MDTLSQIPRNPNFNPGVLAPNNYKARILILGCVDTARIKAILVRRLPNLLCVCVEGKIFLLSLTFFPMKESAAGWRFPLDVERCSLLPGFADSPKDTFEHICHPPPPISPRVVPSSKVPKSSLKLWKGENLLFLITSF